MRRGGLRAAECAEFTAQIAATGKQPSVTSVLPLPVTQAVAHWLSLDFLGQNPQPLPLPLPTEIMNQGGREVGCSWIHSRETSFSKSLSKVEAFHVVKIPLLPCGPQFQTPSPHRHAHGHPCIRTTDWSRIEASSRPL